MAKMFDLINYEKEVSNLDNDQLIDRLVLLRTLHPRTRKETRLNTAKTSVVERVTITRMA